jgi:hypothetical protein
MVIISIYISHQCLSSRRLKLDENFTACITGKHNNTVFDFFFQFLFLVNLIYVNCILFKKLHIFVYFPHFTAYYDDFLYIFEYSLAQKVLSLGNKICKYVL